MKIDSEKFCKRGAGLKIVFAEFSFLLILINSNLQIFGTSFHLNYPQNALLLINNHWLEAQHIWFDGISRFLYFLTIIFPLFCRVLLIKKVLNLSIEKHRIHGSRHV